MWTYGQKSGILIFENQEVAFGYSGNGFYKNDPTSQALCNKGPIPRGMYQMMPPEDTDHHGPYVIRLAPFPENEMHGRAGFLIHGDSKTNPGTASNGCVILPILTRMEMWNSGDHILEVLADAAVA